MSDEYLKVGKIKDAHGIKGDLYCLNFSGQPDWIGKIQQFYLKDPKTLEFKTMEVIGAKPHKKGFIAKVKNLEDRTSAEKLKSLEFYIDKNILSTDQNDQPYLIELEDFRVFDSVGCQIGKITGFLNNGAQDLLLVTSSRKTCEIPFVEEFIIKIDRDKKELHMTLPEGLVEVNW